jgi:predicted Zn-dependent protease
MSGPVTAQQTVERVLELSRADGCVVIAQERSEANLRWANNTLTTNGAMSSRRLTVISVRNGATGAASGVVGRGAVQPGELADLVAASEQAARDAGPADDAAPLVGPDGQAGTEWAAAAAAWDDLPAATSIEVFGRLAPQLGDAFGAAAARDRLLYGYAEHVQETTYLGSSTGLRLRHAQPAGRFQLNGRTADGAASAYAARPSATITDLDVQALLGEVHTRLDWARRTVELPPGRYETILPPAVVTDLILPLMLIFGGARDAEEGRTVFSAPGGGTRIGERIASMPITLRSDPAELGVRCAPFVIATASGGGESSVFDNGAPRPATEWISGGTLGELARHRAWAAGTGTAHAPVPDNLVLTGGAEATGSVQDMIAATGRGLLLTTMWYVRPVDPQTALLTGLTRDGVYLVEDGEVVGAVNNFRWNDSPVSMLHRILAVGRTEPALAREFGEFFTRTAAPVLRVADFNMSTVSQAS